MIDFRYHVVSLVAVFLALAVGILLGAGPLREELSTTLEGQVADLRDERAALRSDLGRAGQQVEQREELIDSLASAALVDRLAGVRVAVVLLPGASEEALGPIADTVATAGGAVVQHVYVPESVESVDTAATRHEVAAELALTLDVPEPRRGSEPTLPGVIAAVLAGAEVPVGGGAADTAAARLSELELLRLEWLDADTTTSPQLPDRRPADLVLVVSGGLEPQETDEAEGSEAVEQRLDLLAALGAVNVPTVLLGAGTDDSAAAAADPDPLIAAARTTSGVSDRVASVDHVDSEAGRITMALAAGWSLMGEPGHYGTGPGAEQVAPAVPPIRVVTEFPGEPEDGPQTPDPSDLPSFGIPPTDNDNDTDDNDNDNDDDAEGGDDSTGGGDDAEVTSEPTSSPGTP